METQVKVNGQVIILADTKPLHQEGYCQWKNVNTGEIWNVDGSKAAVCYNAEIAEAQGPITFLSPTFGDTKDIRVKSHFDDIIQVVECWKDGKSTIHTIVEGIDTRLEENQIKYWNDTKDGQPFMVIFEKGVGYVPSCGTAAVALSLHTGQNIIRCHGGEYRIDKQYYRWTMEAKNIS